ncbi:MAG: hypothetical protein H7123_01215 [Thermoleophilia bacterium]|nr:hypothetical protein [Thermoleophilia bacterium]
MSTTLVHEALGVGYTGAIALGSMILADVLHRTTSLSNEVTRKVSHIGSGIAVLLIPALIDSAITVFVLCAGFAVLMVVTHFSGLLQGMHGVGRGVGGVLWYPLTAFTMYALVFNVMHAPFYMYAIPILVLATADAMGAVVGKRWGRHRYEVIGDHFRSIEGSTAVFTTALIGVAGWLSFTNQLPFINLLLISLATALGVTMLETVSVYGLDNFLVPFGTLFFLHFLSPLSVVELIGQFVLLAACLTGVVLISWKKCTTAGGMVSLLMAAYVVWATGGDAWIMPFTGLLLTFAIYERLSPVADTHTKNRYALGTAASGLAVPVLIALAHDTMKSWNGDALYTAFLAALACDAAIIFFMLPQNRSFVFKRLRRSFATRDLFQPAPTLGKVPLPTVGAAIPLACQPGGLPATPTTVLVLGLALSGVAVFVISAATLRSSHVMCPACGGVNLRGLYCCQDKRLGEGATRATAYSMSFRETFLMANTVAALAAAGVVIWLL